MTGTVFGKVRGCHVVVCSELLWLCAADKAVTAHETHYMQLGLWALGLLSKTDLTSGCACVSKSVHIQVRKLLHCMHSMHSAPIPCTTLCPHPTTTTPAAAAPTVILEQLYSQDLGRAAPSTPHRSMLVWPLKGSYCLFDGRLGHGVLDSCSSTTRATLLVNWWTQWPQAVEQLQDEAIEQQQLTRLDSNCVRDLISTSTSTKSNKISSRTGKSNNGKTNKSSNSNSCDGMREDTGGSVGSADVTARVAAINVTAYSNNKALGFAQSNSTSQQQQQQQGEHRKQYNQQQPAQLPPQQHWQEQRQQQQQLPHVQVTLDAGDAESGMQLVSWS